MSSKITKKYKEPAKPVNRKKQAGPAKRMGNLISNITIVGGAVLSGYLGITKNAWLWLLLIPTLVISVIIYKIGVSLDNKQSH